MSRAPSKLTPDVQSKIVAALSVGARRKHAAGTAGVTESDVKNWIAMGKELNAAEPYASFWRAVQFAENGRIVHALATMHRAAGEDWKAAREALKLWDPESFGDQGKYQVKQALDIIGESIINVVGQQRAREIFEDVGRRTGGELGDISNEEVRHPLDAKLQ